MKHISKIFKRYLVDAMSYMALGLFSSLIVGLIIKKVNSSIKVKEKIQKATTN